MGGEGRRRIVGFGLGGSAVAVSLVFGMVPLVGCISKPAL